MSCDGVLVCSGGYKQSGSLLCRLCCLKATPSCRYHCVCTLSTSTPTSFLQATHSSHSVVAAVNQWIIILVAMKRLACCGMSMPALVCSTVHTTFKRSELPGVGEHIADNVLHEELVECNFINPLRPGDLMGSLAVTTINASAANATRSTTINATTAAASTATTSAANAIATINAASAGTAAATTATAAIDGVETHVNGVLERVKVKTVGIKNMDVRELKGVPLPRALFNTKNLKTKQ
eukprot:7006-Heterococcus_DN1.PRE.1